MAFTTPNSLAYDIAAGNVALPSDTFYGMLLTSSYTPSSTHSKRSDLTNEVTGTGYTAGGQALTGLVLSRSTATTKWTADPLVWSVSTITARYLAIYKHRGGASSADELICVDDFGADKTSTSGEWRWTPNAGGIITLVRV